MAKIKERKDICASDKWDLSLLFANVDEWNIALKQLPILAKTVCSWQNKLASNKENLLCALKDLEVLYRKFEVVGEYASLQLAGDSSDSIAQDLNGRYEALATKIFADISFFEPEILAIDSNLIKEWADSEPFKDYKVYLEKLLWTKPHTLSTKEEKLLSLSSGFAGGASKVFSMLTNVDMKFQDVIVAGNSMPLTQSTWSNFMESPERSVRETAYNNFYHVFESNANTLASLYDNNVQEDIFYARARGYASTLEAALYGNKVPIETYKNLISTVRRHFDILHDYYELRKEVLGLATLEHWDVYVPLVKDIATHTSYDEAVEICTKALEPLGQEYIQILRQGLTTSWVDKYENRGKRSGAFSSGAYESVPYIMLNYKAESLRDVFTMIHEGGHSMHTYYSVHNQPFMQYNYTIFEAEVASTFNEELLFQYLLKTAKDDAMYSWLLSMRLSDIVATLFRQTMFAEYELKCHEAAENGEALSLKMLKDTYQKLLTDYFGNAMHFTNLACLEGFRIPHFYNSFYVYKYATGISAALALSHNVLSKDLEAKTRYFSFLKSGGSRYPLQSLKLAGVDMTQAAPIESAITIFSDILKKLRTILHK